jgi:hypothetical protein
MEEKETGLNERELEEILEMARDAAEKARSMGEVITENSKKWRERAKQSIEPDRDSDRVFLRL